jgi:hypothetical protein
MPFGDGKALVPREQQLAMIPVPPGTYSVRFWQACALNHEVIRTVAIAPANPLARSFEVRRGQVVVLGSFATTTTHSFGQIDWTVEQRQLAASHVEAAILREYPAFRAAPVSCLLCDVVPTGEPEARR